MGRREAVFHERFTIGQNRINGDQLNSKDGFYTKLQRTKCILNYCGLQNKKYIYKSGSRIKYAAIIVLEEIQSSIHSLYHSCTIEILLIL